MEPALSQVYQALLQLQERTGITLPFQGDLQEGLANGAKFYSADLAQFNQLASELTTSADQQQTLHIGQDPLAIVGFGRRVPGHQ
jgi:hypothetical protein